MRLALVIYSIEYGKVSIKGKKKKKKTQLNEAFLLVLYLS